MLSISNS